jgi:alkylation response protein AidB-like acyl-CoA dehydrogenase
MSVSDASPDVLESIVALVPAIRARSTEIERLRRLPLDLVDDLAKAGVFRLLVPRSLAGHEADVPSLLAAIEELSAADGSTGWCAMIGATSGLVSGYLEPSVAREIYGDAGAISGGVFAPRGIARLQGDVYVANGRWAFASGCEHCTYLMGGCMIMEGDQPKRSAAGAPESRMLLFPPSQVKIHDTWDVAGLRGTGSHDIEVRDLEVPVSRAVSIVSDRPRAPGALYRFPVFGLLALGIAAVAIGIARRSIEELHAFASDKTPTGSRRKLAERAAVQSDVARATAELEAARAYMADVVGAAEEEAERGALSPQSRVSLRLAATHATLASATAVNRMYDAGGGTSVYATSPLQRCFRDVHVATQHVMVAPPTFELTGRILLGLDADVSQL